MLLDCNALQTQRKKSIKIREDNFLFETLVFLKQSRDETGFVNLVKPPVQSSKYLETIKLFIVKLSFINDL